MTAPEGYDYRTRSNGEVAIFHHGKLSTLMRGDDAAGFLEALSDGEPQEVMARFAGNDGQNEHPGGGAGAPGVGLHGNGEAHAHQDFRRKTG
ncbi:hypothetical protein [Demequina globuliformis]|uniref:hypothetical protein n=1 Tax=Demequina globuliformis TaxID=676202 RepID=UPI000784EA7E|nr:hypothetical protein [Demequina globuliformis]